MNPLVSAAHRETFGFPMVLLIGWRGEPGVKDEEQHKVQGRHTIDMLKASDVEFYILPDETAAAAKMLMAAKDLALKQRQPVAVLVRPKSLFRPPSAKVDGVPAASLPSRWEVLEALVDHAIGEEDFVVCTTGYASRELYTIRRDKGLTSDSTLLMVGSMGHALAIAQGLALGQPSRKVWCIDGDGASIMHMGTMMSSAALGLSNLYHILINNSVHESVGGQPTAGTQSGRAVNFEGVAQAVRYSHSEVISSTTDLVKRMSTASHGPKFFEVLVKLGFPDKLGRPEMPMREMKANACKFLSKLTLTASVGSPTMALSDSNDPLLFTPGPLTTSLAVKRAMLHDLGSRDVSFVKATTEVLRRILTLAGGDKSYACVPMQGSGTFAVEAMLTSVVPADASILILENGAYGKRIADMCSTHKISYQLSTHDECAPVDVASAVALLRSGKFTHVVIVHCETTTGVLNPVETIARVATEMKCKLLVDVMSSFGIMDINVCTWNAEGIAFSSNKGLQAPPGIGLCVVKRSSLSANGTGRTMALDLGPQHQMIEKCGQWRFTPPTHVLLGLQKALDELDTEGGIVARRTRYSSNCATVVDKMRAIGFEAIVPSEHQAPVILTFPIKAGMEAPALMAYMKERGFILYEGKCTKMATFRVGCMGHIEAAGFLAFCKACHDYLRTASEYELV